MTQRTPDAFPNGKSAIQSCMDSTDYDSVHLPAHYEIDLSNASSDVTREIEFIDAFKLGRYLSHLQTELSIIRTLKSDGIEFEGVKHAQVGKILWEILLVEEILVETQTCPDIQIQIKQQRQKIAYKYVGEHVDGDVEFSDDGAIIFERDEVEEMGLQQIKSSDVRKLYDSVTDWFVIIIEEFNGLVGLTATRNLRLDIVELIHNPESFFRPEVWEWMDQHPRDDFTEACRCLAFDAPTASVMLSLRVVEYCLREWYEFDTDRNIQNRTFGQVLSELEDAYERDDRPHVLSNLDYLKDRRNSVSHPDDSSSRREAERMLYRIEGTISEIYDHINEV